MKIVKRLVIGLVVFFVLIIAAAITLPIIFKDTLLQTVKEEINNNVNAKVDFADVNLSLFRHFPDMSFQIEQFSVVGIDTFQGTTLAKGESLELELDFWSLFDGGPLEVESIALLNPELNIVVLKNGQANYDIAKPTDPAVPQDPAGAESNFLLQLQSYQLTNANIVYDDQGIGFYTALEGVNHEGSGNLTLDVYDLDTHSEIRSLTVAYDDVTYISEAQATLDAIFNIDQGNSKYTLKENELKLNDLLLNFDGYTQLKGEDILLDFTFNTPQNEFKHLLSMIPNAYIEGYENVKATGQFALDGSVKGTYRAEPISYPAILVNLEVDNGQVKYPDLPLGINDIFTKVKVNSPSSDFDDLTVDASEFRMKVGSNPFRAVFQLATPISDPSVNADIDGVLNLKELSQAFPLDSDIESLSGIITADVKINTRMSVVESGAYDRVNMSGYVRIQDLIYDSQTYPTVTIQDARANFTPQRVVLDEVEAKLGKSDLRANGYINNILAYFSPNKTMTGRMNVRSSYFNATEWVPESSESPTPALTTTEGEQAFGAAPVETEIFDRFQFDLDADLKEIVYEDYRLTNTFARGTLAPNRLDIADAGTQIGESDMRVNGYVSNMFDYVFSDGVLGGTVNLVSRRFNLNEFMPESTEPAPANAPSGETPMDPIPVPANIDMTVNADIGEVIYTNMTIREMTGALLIEDQQVIIEDAMANALGGKMAFSGGYDTRDVKNPAFQIKYDLQSMDFQRSFNTFNTFQRLAPIGKFIEGKFNTSLIMDGRLGKNMMPDFSTLNAQGFLETINGVVQGLKPMEAIGNALDIRELKEKLDLLGTRNWFEVKEGRVDVKPFDIKIKDIKMTIGGQHSIALTGGMDYNIQAEIPRAMLENSTLGSAANKGLDLLSQQAGKLGINLAQSEIINVGINLTGSLTDPKTKINLLGADGNVSVASAAEQKAREEMDAAKKELEEEAKAKVEEGKEVVKETTQKAVDSLKTVADQKIDEAKKEVEQKVGEVLKDQAGGLIDSTAKKELDKLLGAGTKDSTAVDDIKNKLDKFNPFKKKKKGGGGR